MSIIVSAAETQRHKERAAATTKRCGTEQIEVARSIVAAKTLNRLRIRLHWMMKRLELFSVSAAATRHRARPHSERHHRTIATAIANWSRPHGERRHVTLAVKTHRIRPTPDALELRA